MSWITTRSVRVSSAERVQFHFLLILIDLDDLFLPPPPTVSSRLHERNKMKIRSICMRVNDASKAQSNSIDLLHSSSHKKREEEAQRVSAEHWTIWNEPEPEQEQFNWDNRLINIIDAQFMSWLGVTNWFTEMGERKNVLLCDCAEEETSKLECYAMSTMPISTSVIFSHISVSE